MNQAAFKILAVVPGKKEKKKTTTFPWGFPNIATDLFYMLNTATPLPHPTKMDFHKNAPRNVSTLISPVPLSRVPFCLAAPVSFPYEFSFSSQTWPWRFSLSSMPLVCHVCHLPPLVPAGIPLAWVECEDSSACATMPLYSQSKCEALECPWFAYIHPLIWAMIVSWYSDTSVIFLYKWKDSFLFF